MKKILALILCCALFFSTAVYASGLSEWAVPEYEAANSAGLVPYSIVANKLTDNVTRVEFCEAAMNFYVILKGEVPELSEIPFSDTDSDAVRMAYTLGVIDGKTLTEFFPDYPITRQEMAKIIMRTLSAADVDTHISLEELQNLCLFDDFGDIENWAANDIGRSVKYEVMNGVTKKLLMPKSFATREQAIAILNRAYNAFCENKVSYEQPVINGLTEGVTVLNNFSFSWSGPKAKKSVVIVKDELGNLVLSQTTKGNFVDLSGKGLEYNREYSVLVGATIAECITVFSDPVSIFFGDEDEVIDVIPSTAGRYARVFPDATPFATEEDAINNMRTITVPIWKLNSKGEKISSTATLVVNLNLADEVIKIFTRIYNDPEQFPIKNVSGYSWRNTAFGSVSQHSYGTCIDINFDENYYCYPSGEAITGSFWKPYEDPFSITPDGSVVKTFSKYGWTWGGNWTNLKDYMHFSYLGK